jgi:hypothetical protein
MRQSSAVHPLCPEHVDVIKGGKLFGGECLGRAEHHVTGIVDDDVEAPVLIHDRGDGGLHRDIGLNIHLDDPQREVLASGQRSNVRGVLRVPAADGPHPGNDRVTGARQ